jgi:hypothetical protein
MRDKKLAFLHLDIGNSKKGLFSSASQNDTLAFHQIPNNQEFVWAVTGRLGSLIIPYERPIEYGPFLRAPRLVASRWTGQICFTALLGLMTFFHLYRF